MINLSAPMPEGAFSALRLEPDEFAREIRVAAAMQWYAQGRVSQDKAAEMAGLTRAALIEALSQARISPFQFSAETLLEDLCECDPLSPRPIPRTD